MDLPIVEPSEIPLPPEEVRITSIHAEPYPDGRRIRLTMGVSPFQLPPDIDVSVVNKDDEEVASLSVIGAVNNKLGLTLHLRGSATPGHFRIRVSIRYAEIGTVARKEIGFMISGSSE